MTNAQIILSESIKLMNEGIIKGSGIYGTIENEDGSKTEFEFPEEIHTFANWKANGRQVKKGERAKASIYIWKYSQKTEQMEMTNVETGQAEVIDVDNSKMFMKKSFFFTIDQTEPIK